MSQMSLTISDSRLNALPRYVCFVEVLFSVDTFSVSSNSTFRTHFRKSPRMESVFRRLIGCISSSDSRCSLSSFRFLLLLVSGDHLEQEVHFFIFRGIFNVPPDFVQLLNSSNIRQTLLLLLTIVQHNLDVTDVSLAACDLLALITGR